ncbi:predicted protein [Naegleria gruberi]|uniref:Predicted protein n=1 Tax=Naegleria gruberi TaxID=5762 RepID=D2VMT3_NAEGR|nr:uncharacterized protein NAEGRDRAFT_70251 [Naegleria gruberi]EFC41791.1 predicted protein [Naegleria gruberi]|eukprot:XP_002674535.1 predicted protein [Naegleria gruberi strain NEG-M]
MSPLNTSLFIFCILAVLTPTIYSQYLVVSPSTYLPGQYYVTLSMNSSSPVNLGHSSNTQAAYTTSTGFTLLRSNILNGTYYFRIGSVSSSTGNYVIFNSASTFQISYRIGESFNNFYPSSSSNSYSIPAYGTERLYASSSYRSGESYTLQFKSSRTTSVKIAYTFNIETEPSYSSYQITSSRSASISFTVPTTSSIYPTFYLYIQCNNGISDCGTITVETPRSDDAGMIIGIVIGVFILFIIISVAISIPSVIAAKKRRMMALAAVTAASKHGDFATTNNAIVQPTMPPGAYQPMVQQIPTMPPGAYYNQQQPSTMPPGAYQPIMVQNQMTVQNYQPYVVDPQVQPYSGQLQYGNQPMPAFNPNVDRV